MQDDINKMILDSSKPIEELSIEKMTTSKAFDEVRQKVKKNSNRPRKEGSLH